MAANSSIPSTLNRHKYQESNLIIYLPVVNNLSPGHTTNFYYVDSINGSDANSGTSKSTPWLTIQHAANTVVAGATVYIRGGTYNERVNLYYRNNTTGPYITFINYPGESVILDGTGIDIQYGEGLFHIKKTDYIRVSGLKIQTLQWCRNLCCLFK